MTQPSWNFSRSAAGTLSWLDYLRDPLRPRVASDGAPAVVRAMVQGLSESTLRLLGSEESLEEIFSSLVHPTNSLVDPAGMRLSPAFTWSRGEVLASMGGMRVPVDELRAEARSQSQVEAVQQFQIAREAFVDRRFSESLEALTRALDTGPSLMVAGRLVWRIHLLRALVLLGSDDNTDASLIDPAEAEQSFLLAARYARTEYRLDAARALLGAGWAAYVKDQGEADRRIKAAVTYTGEALDLDGDLSEAQFQSAKFRMALGEADAALHGLRWLPLSGRVLLLKAAADGDFQSHSAKFEAFLETLRDEQLKKIHSEVSPIAARIGQWMADCPELAATPAAQRLVDLASGAVDRGLLDVHRYFGFAFREDRESLRDSFFEVKRSVAKEWDEEVVEPMPDEAEPPLDSGLGERRVPYRVESRLQRKIIHHVDQEPEYQFLNGLGEVLTTYRGVPGSRKEFPLPTGEGSVSLPVRWIPPGRFLMGSPLQEPDREPDEVLHRVSLHDGFFFTETLCTQEQWSRLMPDNPSRFRGPRLPVEQVSWEEAREFARRLTEFHLKEGLISSGWHWDLPTEAQWEYACRVRKPGEFHGPIDAVAWHQGNSQKRTQPVGLKEPNAWGLHDMHGNVGKWCLDWYGQYPFETVNHPAGPAFGTFRVYRGGGWSDTARCCRSAYRGRSVPDFRSSNIGFSLVLAGPISEIPAVTTR
jgi:formylglycine-generating enzyme required for sulfatase activity